MNFCIEHGYFIRECPGCVVWKSDALKVLEARISDQAAEIQALRRQINDLATRFEDLRRAHNVSVS